MRLRRAIVMVRPFSKGFRTKKGVGLNDGAVASNAPPTEAGTTNLRFSKSVGWRILPPRCGVSMPSVFIKTYGCQMNERDSEAVAAQLAARGYAMAPSE